MYKYLYNICTVLFTVYSVSEVEFNAVQISDLVGGSVVVKPILTVPLPRTKLTLG